jgi:hypothetical protein
MLIDSPQLKTGMYEGSFLPIDFHKISTVMESG